MVRLQGQVADQVTQVADQWTAKCRGVAEEARTSRLVGNVGGSSFGGGIGDQPGLVGMLAAGIQQLQQAQLNMMNQNGSAGAGEAWDCSFASIGSSWR